EAAPSSRRGAISFAPSRRRTLHTAERCLLHTAESGAPFTLRSGVFFTPWSGASFAPQRRRHPSRRGAVSLRLRGRAPFTLRSGVFFTPRGAVPPFTLRSGALSRREGGATLHAAVQFLCACEVAHTSHRGTVSSSHRGERCLLSRCGAVLFRAAKEAPPF